MLSKNATVIAVIALSASSFAAAPVVFSNGSPDPGTPAIATGFVTTSGVIAPQGAVWSELQAQNGAANALAGLAFHRGDSPGSYRLADDFEVPAGSPAWRIEAFEFYAYAAGLEGPLAPGDFGAIHLRVWNLPPNEPSRSLIWESSEQSATFAPATPTSIYRVFNTGVAPAVAPDASRPLWLLSVAPSRLSLHSGRYWLDWQINMPSPQASALSPLVTIAALRSQATFNAMQFKPIDGVGAWTPVIDHGKPSTGTDLPLDLPFNVRATPAPQCPGDTDGSGTVGFSDVTLVLNNWGVQDPSGIGPGDGNGDGIVDFADITTIMTGWGTPCAAP